MQSRVVISTFVVPSHWAAQHFRDLTPTSQSTTEYHYAGFADRKQKPEGTYFHAQFCTQPESISVWSLSESPVESNQDQRSTDGDDISLCATASLSPEDWFKRLNVLAPQKQCHASMGAWSQLWSPYLTPNSQPKHSRPWHTDSSKPEGGPCSLVMFLESAPAGRVSTQGWVLGSQPSLILNYSHICWEQFLKNFTPRLPSAHAGWLSAQNHLEQEMPPQLVSMAKNRAG